MSALPSPRQHMKRTACSFVIVVAGRTLALVREIACRAMSCLSRFVVPLTGALVINVADSPVAPSVSAMQRDLAAGLDLSLACCVLTGIGRGGNLRIKQLAISYLVFAF
jgi:hypothetical protein